MIDEIYSVGSMMKLFDKNINNKVKLHNHFSDRTLLKKYLNKLELMDSVILFKGSRGMKMEEFVSLIQTRMN